MDMEIAELIKIETLSQRWDVSKNTLRTWIQRKTIPYYKINGCVRFDLKEVTEWLAKKRVKTAEEAMSELEKKLR